MTALRSRSLIVIRSPEGLCGFVGFVSRRRKAPKRRTICHVCCAFLAIVAVLLQGVFAHVHTITVIHCRCYMSGGTWEPYRDDAKEFPKALMGSSVSHWDETYV